MHSEAASCDHGGMSELGSIFEDEAGPRGRDLHTRITFARTGLGKPTAIQVPLELPLDGVLVRRAIGPGETDATVTLNLPVDLPAQATLRMRGLGEEIDDGPPGDLYLAVTLTEGTPPGRPIGGWLVAGGVLIAAAVATYLTR